MKTQIAELSDTGALECTGKKTEHFLIGKVVCVRTTAGKKSTFLPAATATSQPRSLGSLAPQSWLDVLPKKNTQLKTQSRSLQKYREHIATAQ